MDRAQSDFRRKLVISIFVTLTVVSVFLFVSVSQAFSQESVAQDETVSEAQAGIAKFGLIAASIAFGFGAIGAGIAIAHVGSAAMGAIGEKPEIASQALIFIALAEGLVVFGFITALMILGKF